MLKYIYALFLCLFCVRLIGQTRLVDGMVYDRSTLQPIPNVNIIVEPTKVGAMTNDIGQFYIDVTDNDLEMVFKHIGYDEKRVGLDTWVNGGKIPMDPKVIELKKLDVIGESKGEFDQFETENMLSELSAEDLTIRGYSDIADAIYNEETIVVNETMVGHKTVSIRGARQEEMVYMYDGVKINNAGDRSMDLSIFNAGGLDGVEIVRGGHDGSVSSSGTINFIPSLPYRNRAQFYQRFGTYDTGNWQGSVAIGTDKIVVNLGSGRMRSSQFYNESAQADIIGVFDNTFINLGIKPFRGTEIRAFSFRNEREYENIRLNDSLSANFRAFILKLRYEGVELGVLDLFTSHQQDSGKDKTMFISSHKKDEESLIGFQYSLPIPHASISITGDLLRAVSDWNTSFGVIHSKRSRSTLTGVFALNEPETQSEIGLKDLNIIFNWRSVVDSPDDDTQYLTNEVVWEEKGVQLSISAWNKQENSAVYLYSNLGNVFRIPGLNERYTHALRPIFFLSDSLMPEHKLMREIGLKLSNDKIIGQPAYSGTLSLFSYGYTNKMRPIHYSSTPMKFSVNHGNADISGLEIDIEVSLMKDQVELTTGYALYNMSDRSAFPMQPDDMLKNTLNFNWKGFSIMLGSRKESARVITTIDPNGNLVDNRLDPHMAIDGNLSFYLPFKRFTGSFGVSGRNLLGESQFLEGISIFDRRIYLNFGVEWN